MEFFEKMLEDFKQLNEKVDKLRKFILEDKEYEKIEAIQKDLLIAQLKAMETYLSVLSIRMGINHKPEELTSEDSQ